MLALSVVEGLALALSLLQDAVPRGEVVDADTGRLILETAR